MILCEDFIIMSYVIGTTSASICDEFGLTDEQGIWLNSRLLNF